MPGTIYHLRARSPFHLGRRGIGLEETAEYLPADTLFAALCLSLRAWRGNNRLEAFLAAFPRDGATKTPPLLLSSAFPFAGSPDGGELVRFYPRPRCPARDAGDWRDNFQTRKKAKKIAWVSETIFQAWVQGHRLKEYFDEKDNNFLHGGKVWLAGDEREWLSKLAEGGVLKLWTTAPSTRVALDRASAASQVYQVERLYFAPGGGLWFAMRWFDETWRSDVEDALRILGDEGVGGERSSGHGQFEMQEFHPTELPEPAGDPWLTLSPYHPPSPGEAGRVMGEGARYQLLARRGWLSSPQGEKGRNLRHKTVRMLGEGSMLTGGRAGNIYGDLVTVTPDQFKDAHPVYRYGLAFPVGVYPEANNG